MLEQTLEHTKLLDACKCLLSRGEEQLHELLSLRRRPALAERLVGLRCGFQAVYAPSAFLYVSRTRTRTQEG